MADALSNAMPGLQTAEELIGRSRRLIAEGRPEEGSVVAMLAVRLHPGDADAHLHMIDSLRGLRQHAAALEATRTAVAAVPGDARLRVAEADLLIAAGDFEGATRALAEAVTLDPADPGHADRLGLLLQELGQFDRAAVCHADAFDRGPTNPAPLCHMAVCMLHMGAAESALEALDHAAGLPGYDQGFELHRSIALHLLDRDEDAAGTMQELILRGGGDARGYLHLGVVLAALGRGDEAAGAFDTASLLDGGDGRIRHAALTWQGHDRAPDQAGRYVARILNPAAAAYDDHQLDVRQFRVPGLLERTLDARAGAETRFGRVLDLGCRTGLVGLVLRSRAEILVGIDPDPALLREAAAKDTYDGLHAGDPLALMASRQEVFDLIVAHDLPATMPSLEPLFAGLAAHLSPGGLAILVTQAGYGADSEPAAGGRHKHGALYLETLTERAGLTSEGLESEELHLDGGLWVEGWIVAVRKPAD
jgi:predicted TPR repeat methyltransferase